MSSSVWVLPMVYRDRLDAARLAVLSFDHHDDDWKPDGISMSCYAKPCGSPSCVLGHYAARPDLQTILLLGRDDSDGSHFLMDAVTRKEIAYYHDVILAHFGITPDEAHDLFSSGGCDWASTPQEVSDYMAAFIARKYPEMPT